MSIQDPSAPSRPRRLPLLHRIPGAQSLGGRVVLILVPTLALVIAR